MCLISLLVPLTKLVLLSLKLLLREQGNLFCLRKVLALQYLMTPLGTFSDQRTRILDYLQITFYSYQHSIGEMRLRVTTLSRRWVAGPRSIQDLIAGFDQEAAAVVMARLVSFKMEIVSEFDPIRWLDKALIHICSRFGDYQKDNPLLSACLQSFQSFLSSCFSCSVHNLSRLVHTVQVFNSSPDETAYFRMILNRENVTNSVVMTQPSLISYSFQSAPEPALLDVAAVAADRILLLDSYFTIVIFMAQLLLSGKKLDTTINLSFGCNNQGKVSSSSTILL